MEKQRIPAKQGRPSKDAALALRDLYWVLYLKRRLPEDSYASIERKLFPHLRISKREHGEGFSQPGSLSKVAAGKRGLSASLEGIPDVVRNAEALVPGAIAAYNSILWRALAEPNAWLDSCQDVAPEAQIRLFAHHFQALPAMHAGRSRPGALSLYGVRRVSRLWHRDALGLLLCHCPPVIGISPLSFTAENYVLHLLNWACRRDVTLLTVKDDLLALIGDRYGVTGQVDAVDKDRIFLAPRLGGISYSLRMLLGPRQATSRI
ncbi:MAG: hypothetical protein E2585_15160 [Comamonas sp.]|uniref:hypothetical protein n=1 Tax=Comamonas TaxID=283 RepID=UPI0011868A37|nr:MULTISPECIES: hypothetical protein [Comamonas]MPS90003.1 hypothetical protein [Comamonas sp.]